jgi:hypothetical protein
MAMRRLRQPANTAVGMVALTAVVAVDMGASEE